MMVFFLLLLINPVSYGEPCRIVCHEGKWYGQGNCENTVTYLIGSIIVKFNFPCDRTPDWLIPKVKTAGRMQHRNHTKRSYRPPRPPVNNPQVDADETFTFTHTLEGDWPDVVGYVCFLIKGQTAGTESYICLIGLATELLGNNEYQSEEWDKKIFWIDVGDGAPMHVCALYVPNYEEDGIAYDNVYWAPNFVYRAPGSDENRDCDMWMYLDEEDEVEEVWIDIYDEAGEEVTKTKELAIGDRLTSYAPAIYLDEPDVFGIATAEDRWQTVKAPPVFLYAHMTPNVDFEKTATKGVIDFNEVELYYILKGENEDEEGVVEHVFSTPKKLDMKWGNQPAKAENWFLHGISGILNFFLPSYFSVSKR